MCVCFYFPSHSAVRAEEGGGVGDYTALLPAHLPAAPVGACNAAREFSFWEMG